MQHILFHVSSDKHKPEIESLDEKQEENDESSGKSSGKCSFESSCGFSLQ
jgi:hypothetical protein